MNLQVSIAGQEIETQEGKEWTNHVVAVSRGYDTCFGKRLVMGYADCKNSLFLVETSK